MTLDTSNRYALSCAYIMKNYAGGYKGHLSKDNGAIVTLWAQWERLSVHSSITYNNLGKAAVAVDMSSLPEIVYGNTVILPTLSSGSLNEPFLGWSTDGGKTVAAPGTPLYLGSSDNEPVITAVWGAVPYEILKGAFAKWQKGSSVGIEISSSADIDKFLYVNMDNAKVDEGNYAVKKGSTVVVFKAEYLETLSVGDHDVEIVSNDGSAHTTLTIVELDKVASDEGVDVEDSRVGQEKSNDQDGIPENHKETSSSSISSTGDAILYVVLGILALGVVGISSMLIIRKRRK